IRVSPFADSAASSSPSNVSTDHIPLDVVFESTSGGINDFFLESDEEEQIGLSRVAADPDSDDKVLAEILFRGKPISGNGVVLVDKLPDDEIVDPRVKVETVTESAASPPRSRRKNLGERSAASLWDKPVEDFFSSESESDTDMENYIPPLPYGTFKDWEMVSCPPGNNHIHVYYQQNRRRKYFTYLKELLPHVYHEDLLLLRRRMNRYFQLNPEVDVGLDLWRDVNLLCQSLHSDDVEDFWRTQDEWIVSSWKLYPKSSVHVLDLTNGKTVYMFVDKFYPIRATLLERMLRHRLKVPPSYCRDVVVTGSVIQTVQTGLRKAYECLASAPFACTARQMVFSSPWLTAKKESGSPLQTALVCNSNPLIATVRLLFLDDALLLNKTLLILLFIEYMRFPFLMAASFGYAAPDFLLACNFSFGRLPFSSSVPADYVPAGHVLISALKKCTVKDKFLIPIIEELIDELCGATVFSKLDLRFRTMEEHVIHLRMVLDTMRSNKLYAKQTKCVFGTTHVEYSGHIISAQGVAIDPNKVIAMQKWHVPNNIKQLRGFLGLSGYYRRFIKGLASLSKPLTQLLKKNAFYWNVEAQSSFEALKQALMEAPVLGLPEFNELFLVETDALSIRLGAVLQQKGHPIAYLSKTLSHKHQTLSTYEKEFLAILMALER
ncbi:reverse transcriptase domain-containing protein, partial [Tanacetum coccineum]